MIFRLMLRGLKKGRARFACAVCGIAVSVGAVVFMSSLAATNRAQGPELARRAARPWAAWRVEDGPVPKGEGTVPAADLRLGLVSLEVDYRENGHVLQGPPMRALVAGIPEMREEIYDGFALSEGRWADDDAPEPEIVAVRSALKRFGRGKEPELGSFVVFTLRGGRGGRRAGGEAGVLALPVGRSGNTKLVARLVGYLDGGKIPSTFPGVFANKAAISTLPQDAIGAISFWKSIPRTTNHEPRTTNREPPTTSHEILTPASPQVVAAFTGDEQRRMDYATPLLLAAAVLTAVALLVLSLLLSIESNRRTLMTLRTIGLTRFGVVRFVFYESLYEGVVGWMVGTTIAFVALFFLFGDSQAFPAGMVLDVPRLFLTLLLIPVVALFAVLFALAPALRVRAGDASALRPRTHRWGMAVTFALGFAAFVAVEVWGASLMRAFVPSPEWPDAIVSILPGGVRSSEAVMEPLRKIGGVRRISELAPLQVPLADAPEAATPGRGGPRGAPNILFLASEWLPEFKYVEGSHADAEPRWREGEGVVISEITSRALNLHKGDLLKVEAKGRRGPSVRHELPVLGVADLNWHMVTSRGLVRGMNGASPMTEGPAFISFDALGAIDPSAVTVGPSLDAENPEAVGEGEKPMTHLWVDYEPDFLARHGVFPAGRLVEEAIDEALGRPKNSTVQLHARDEIADGTLAHGSDIIGEVARIPFVFLAILALGFVAMLVAEAEASRAEFAVLRAVGATRLQLARRLARSALRTAFAGILFGLPVGALAGWLATFRTGAWKGLPHWFVLPVDVVAEGALGALVFALAFAVPTALTLVARSTRRA